MDKNKNHIRGYSPGFFMYLLMILVCLVAFFPFYWLVNTSLQPQATLYKLPIKYFPSLSPLKSYLDYLKTSPILLWIKNSLIVSVVTCVCSTLLGVPCAYAISRFRFKLRTSYIFLILFTQMMSASFLCIPFYMLYSKLKMINTLLCLMIIYTCTTLPISVWFSKGFCDSLPLELEESARIDGANTAQVLGRIVLPLLRPGIVATGTWVFICAWDEYLYAYTMVSDNKLWTNSVGLASYIGEYNTPWNKIMTGAVIVTLPVVFLFMYFQKYLVSGLTAGSVKA